MMSSHILLPLMITGLLLAAPAAHAQPASAGTGQKSQPAGSTAMTDTARQLYDEGLKALEAERSDVAHAKFTAAWRIHQHYQIAGNLGFAEEKLGMYRDAAEHLSFYLRESPSTKVAERKVAEASLKKALAHVGSVTLHVVPEGAEVAIDGALVGAAPLSGPVFLQPGEHAITARMDGYVRARVTVTATAGGSQEVTVRMLPEVTPSVPVVPPEVPTVAPAPEKRSLVPAIALGAGSVVGIAVGVGLTVASNGASSDADAQGAAILGAGGQCVAPGSFAAQCEALASTLERRDALGNGAGVAYASAGALAIGAAVYLLWPQERSGAAQRELTVVPVVGMREGGLGVRGMW